MDLSGTWRATVADEDLHRRYPQRDFPDSDWAEVTVPGHWRSSPGFAGADGPLLFRRRFEADRVATGGGRWWVTFEGVFYQSDVWLDGRYLGDTEGYFFPHTFEVTNELTAATEHVLAVEVTCAPQRDRAAKRNLTGVFQHWDCLDPDWNPGGIWRPVRLGRTGPVRITRMRVLCGDASPERAVLSVRTVLDAAEACSVRLRTTVGELVERTEDHRLAAGENRVEWQVTVERPQLWWPHALGDQPLHDVTVEASIADTDGPSDSRVVKTGIRQVRQRRWILSVNGERLFLKGSNQGPTRMQLAEATPRDLETDVVLAKQAGLDFLRLHAHVSRPELYAAADRHGLLIWQDLPLQWGYARSIRKQAVRQAREAVDALGHHPSVFLWCGHNEPMALDVEPGGDLDLGRLAGKVFRMQQLPTWNKTVLDRTIRRALEKADRTRPVVAHSGIPPHVGSTGTDSHLYFGWYHGQERDLPKFLSAWPNMGRFITEFGAQAVPDEAGFMAPDRWPDLPWERLGRTHALQRRFFARVGLDPAEFATFESWRDATQRYQAELIRFHVETIRRLKYRPAGGFAQFCFADGHPAVTWSVLDHRRKPKVGYIALTAACSPVIIVADRPAIAYSPGDRLRLDVHIVSDLREAVTEAAVRAHLSWRGGEQDWRWAGEAPPDSCVRVGHIDFLVPDSQGPMTLELDLDSTVAKAANRYEARIAAS